ncbi:hypothetical protein EJB05_03281, partial [Eragrostis curvula]
MAEDSRRALSRVGGLSITSLRTELNIPRMECRIEVIIVRACFYFQLQNYQRLRKNDVQAKQITFRTSRRTDISSRYIRRKHFVNLIGGCL